MSRVVLQAVVGFVATSFAFFCDPSLGAPRELLINPTFEQNAAATSGPHGVPYGWKIEELPLVPAQPGPYRCDYNNGGVTSTPCLSTNHCNAVDAADYTVWRDNLGASIALPNRYQLLSGPVNQFDYDVWKFDFGLPRTMDLIQSSNFHPLDDDWNMWFQPYNGTIANATDNSAHLTQTVPGRPGLIYTMTAYALFENYFPGGVTNLNTGSGSPSGAPFDDGPLSPTDTYLGLDFLSSTGAVLAGSVEIELKAAGQPSNTSWMKHTLIGRAPAGTTAVRVRASMTDGVLNPLPSPQIFEMAFYVDAFSLTAIPEPSTFILCATVLIAYRMRRLRFLSEQPSTTAESPSTSPYDL